jgi:hypothetical protein
MAMSEPDQQRSSTAEALESIPGLARLAGSLWWHSAGWALRTSVRASWLLADAATSPRKAIHLAADVRHAAGSLLRDVSDAIDLEQRMGPAAVAADVARRVADAVPVPAAITDADGLEPARNGSVGQRTGVPGSLRAEGEQLLQRSRDVHYELDAHPAYERILSDLAPDEARILRLMLLEGPQPSVDIRTGGPVGMVRSRLVAPGLSMIGARAGCRYVERVPSYLNNLFRLGLVWFSRETLKDPLRYQVLEAQPDVLEAIHSVSDAKVVRRSIHLTPFGEDFCRVCLTSDTTTLESVPPHCSPPEHEATPQPPSVSES